MANPGPQAGAGAAQQPAAPRASVVIVVYNAQADLARCLRSLAAAGHPQDEIIVVDNASRDGSADMVESAFPAVRLVRSASNVGFGEGNNLGAAQARGRYLAFLNPDTEVTPGWLDALIAALESSPRVGMATAKILLREERERINTCGGDTHLTGLTLCRGMGQQRDEMAEPAAVGAVSGAAFVMRRALFRQVGGFDGSFFMYMEDTDLSWRVRLAGYTCLYAPEAVVYHRYNLRFGPDKTYYQERNRYVMLLKGLRWPTLLLLAPALLLAEVVTWGYVLVGDRPRWRNKLRAYGYIVRHWPAIMAERRRVQAQRGAADRTLLRQTTHHLAYEQTGDGLAASLAHWVFDPLFLLFRQAALAATRW